MSSRRFVDGIRVIDDREDGDRLVVDGGDPHAVLPSDEPLDALVQALSLRAEDQIAVLETLEGLPGGAITLATLDDAGLTERCCHDGLPRADILPPSLEQFLSRTLSCSAAFLCRHEAFARLGTTRVWPFGAVDLLPDLPEVLASNGMPRKSSPVDGDVFGLGIADLDSDVVCPVPPDGFPDDASWLRVGVSPTRGVVELGPVWEPGLHMCHRCFVTGWPSLHESGDGDHDHAVAPATVRRLATAWATTELLALRVLTPRSRVKQTTGWCRLEVATCTEHDMVLPQFADCLVCGGGNLGCTVSVEPSVGRFEERYQRASFVYVVPRDLVRQNERAAEARQRSEDRRSDLRSVDGGFLLDGDRPWHAWRTDTTSDLEQLAEAAVSDLERVELACSLAVGVMTRPGSPDGVPRHSAPSGGNIREYLIMGTRDGDDVPADGDEVPFWFDDGACRFRRLVHCGPLRGEPTDPSSSLQISGSNALQLTLVTDPALLAHKYALHGLRVAYLDAGAAAYYLLSTLRWMGFDRCVLSEPRDWSTWMERAGLNTDLWRLGTGIRVA